MATFTHPSDMWKSTQAGEYMQGGCAACFVSAERTRMPMIRTQSQAARKPIVFVNDSFLNLTGYGRDEILAQDFEFLLADDSEPEDLAKIAAAFEGEDVDPEAHFRRKNDSTFWAAVFVSPVHDAGGKVIEHFVSLVNTTRHKDEQERCRLLINELNHRVKSTLTTVQSIISQTIRREPDPELMRDSIESRIFSLSRSHDLLTDMNWKGAWLDDVVEAALEPFRDADGNADGHTERFAIIGGGPIGLTPRATLSLGIAFHELAANATKFGALSNEHGTVEVSWTIRPSSPIPRLIIQWRERHGPTVAAPTHKGFGTQVIERGLAHDLGGEVHLDYQPGGLVCVIDVPAPQEAFDE